MKPLHSLALIALLAASTALFAADTTTAPAAPAPGPKNEAGLTATLIATKDTYTLNPAQAGKDFRDNLDALNKGQGVPKPPAVDLILRVTNTTDADLTISMGGDDSNISLNLTGPNPGPISIAPLLPMTMEFRIGKPMPIAAGKSADIKITSLAAGMRGMSQYTYWTEPGEYTLTATLTYPNAAGDKQLKVISGPAKLTVTK
jgi:hypothetical protein